MEIPEAFYRILQVSPGSSYKDILDSYTKLRSELLMSSSLTEIDRRQKIAQIDHAFDKLATGPSSEPKSEAVMDSRPPRVTPLRDIENDEPALSSAVFRGEERFLGDIVRLILTLTIWGVTGAAWLTHIVAAFQTQAWGIGIVGAVIFPLGMLLGFLRWFGVIG